MMTQVSAPPPASLPKWMKIIVILSFTLNLAVIGLVGGLALRFAGGRDVPMIAAQNLGYGPWSRAFEREDYRALRRAFEAGGHDFRAFARAETEDRAALIAALRSAPFDVAAFDAATLRMAQRGRERLDLGQDLIRAHVIALSQDRREKIADRMERRSKDRERR